MSKLTQEVCVQRVKKINKNLRDKNYSWEEIEKFWLNVFAFCEKIGMKKIKKVETFKIGKNGNNLHSNRKRNRHSL